MLRWHRPEQTFDGELAHDGDLAQPTRTIWIVSVAGAVAIHAVCIALALATLQRDDEQDLGAPAIAISLELASPERDPTDLPVGPDTDASAAAPEVIEQKTVVEKTDLPKETPTETDDPDRLVSPNDPNPVKDIDPKKASVQAQPSQASVATDATAMPTVENAAQSPHSVAPSQGIGTSAERARVTWEKELAAHFNKYKRYPEDRPPQSAQVVVSFVLDRSGLVLSSHIVTGSGDPAFDAAALAMLRRANPVPPPPPLVADYGLSFTLPVIFNVKTRR
jgi:periplasmic protein TonB